MSGAQLKAKLATKDGAGAIGALGTSGIGIAYQQDIQTVYNALWTWIGIWEHVVPSVTNLSTGLTIVIITAFGSYLTSAIAKD